MRSWLILIYILYVKLHGFPKIKLENGVVKTLEIRMIFESSNSFEIRVPKDHVPIFSIEHTKLERGPPFVYIM